MQQSKTGPHAHLRPSVWAGRLTLGRFVLTLSVNRQRDRDNASVTLSNRLAQLRRERGFSREQLAEHLQIHPSTLIAMESGDYVPSLALAVRASEVFEVPVEAIFFSSSTKKSGLDAPSQAGREIDARA